MNENDDPDDLVARFGLSPELEWRIISVLMDRESMAYLLDIIDREIEFRLTKSGDGWEAAQRMMLAAMKDQFVVIFRNLWGEDWDAYDPDD